MDPNDQIESLLQNLYATWDDETEASSTARKILLFGPRGVDVLVDVLARASGEHPKLAVGVLHAFQSSMEPYARRRLLWLQQNGRLAEDDETYLLTILAEFNSHDPELKKRLVRKLRRTKDPIDLGEVLADIVRLSVSEAKPVLTRMAKGIGPDDLDYGKDAEDAIRVERILFALRALEGDHNFLEEIVFDLKAHSLRRAAALDNLCLSRGTESKVVLRRAAEDADKLVRKTAMELVAELGLMDCVDLVERALIDPEAWVVQAAAYAIRDLNKKPEFSEDLNRLREVHEKVLEALRAREGSQDRTDRQIMVPVLRKVAAMLEESLAKAH